MSEVIYRKYRPNSFEEVVGLEHVKKILLEQINNNKISHAYLFAGPRGTGKTTMARLFSKKINKIDNVNKISDADLDIIEIDAASNRGIEEIRELKKKINFVPAMYKYKVYIIDEVHMLTKEAFNALLKTLEEPPKHVVFILATTEGHKIPMTILSRVMRFDFDLASNKELIEKYSKILKGEGYKFEDEVLELIVKYARGSFRDGESLLEKIINGVEGKKIKKTDVSRILGLVDLELIDNFIESVREDRVEEAIRIISEANNSGIRLPQFCNQVLDNLREILVKIVAHERDDWELSKIGLFMKEISVASKDMRDAVIEELPLEIAILNACNLIPRQTVNVKKTSNVTAKRIEIEETEVITINPLKTSISSISEIQEGWNNLLQNLKKHNHHLTAFLTKSKPVEISNSVLIIEVPFEFHAKKLSEKKTKDLICKEMSQLWGNGFEYEVRINSVKTAENREEYEHSDNESNGNEGLIEEVFDIK